MKRNLNTIICTNTECNNLVGTVQEIENSPGFFSNVPTPNPMPTRCPKCQSPTTWVINLTGGK